MIGRIYLRPSKDYFQGVVKISTKDIDYLIENIAETIGRDKGGKELIIKQVSSMDKRVNRIVAHGRTKKMIAQEAHDFIKKFNHVYDAESMGDYVSIKQVYKLFSLLEKGDGIISGYSFVIIHIIYYILNQNVNVIEQDKKLYNTLVNCTSLIEKVLDDYLEDYPNDVVAIFLLNCKQAVYNEIVNLLQPIEAKEFPAIPRKTLNQILNKPN